jgi:hypothetical protein
MFDFVRYAIDLVRIARARHGHDASAARIVIRRFPGHLGGDHLADAEARIPVRVRYGRNAPFWPRTM